MFQKLIITGFLICAAIGANSQEVKAKKKKHSKQVEATPTQAAPEKQNGKIKPVQNQQPSNTATPVNNTTPGTLPTINSAPNNTSTQSELQQIEPNRTNTGRTNVNAANTDLKEIFQPVVTQQTNGSIDWTNQYIEAKGEAVIDLERFKTPGQAKAMATRGATVVAQRNLLEIINGVNVVGETTVRDMIIESDLIQTRVEGLLKGAQLVGEPVEKNGMMEVVMRVPLYETNGLAPIVHDQALKTRSKGISTEESPYASSSNPLIAERSTKAANTEEIQNMVFNLTGKKYDPAMFPVIVDENNKILLDLSKYYDPKKGNFPKIMETSRKVFETANYKNGTEVIDLISAQSGKFVVPDNIASKINWKKIGATAAKIGTFLLMLI
jgi:hypothetical protein